jgi:hypothetical protein
MEITKVSWKIRGICTVLFDRNTGEVPGSDEDAKKQAPAKVYRDGKGEISVPADMLKASVRNAGREIGKKMESKKREQAIRAGVFFDREAYSLGIKDFDGLHAEMVTRKGTGNKVTRVMSYRPYIKEGWEIEGTVLLYGVSAQLFKESLELAGFKFGLGSHRPEFGRFEVLECAEVAVDAKAKKKSAA